MTKEQSKPAESRAAPGSVADRMQHIRLDPERVARFTGPDTQPRRCRGDGLFCFSRRDDSASRVWIRGVRAPQTPYGITLFSLWITLFECQTVGEVFNRIAVQIDFEFVHPLRMVAGCRDGPEN